MAEELDITLSVEKRPVADIDVSTLCQQFEDSVDDSQQERELSEQCRDYYAGDQLTDAELDALAKRGQPPVISNRIAPKIDALIGYERKRRTDPKAYPRTPKHEDEAQSITDALRFVCEENKFDDVRTHVAETMFIEGLGAAKVAAKVVNGRPEVDIQWVPWDRFYRDPHSRMRDFSDATYLGEVLWMDEAEVLRMFPGSDDVIESCYASGVDMGDTFDDRPSIQWGDRKRHRVRVLQHRFRHKGEWWTTTFCKGGYLRDPQPSPYVDENGERQCDLIATSAYIDRENRRYGIVKRMLSPQDEINKRRSKALHLLNSRKIIAEKGSVDSVYTARREAARPDGYLEVNPDMRFEFVDEQQLVAGQFSLLQESKNEIDASGVNPAIEGDAQAPSGRAQQMLVQAGLSEMSGVFDALQSWSWEVYRQVWYRVRQYWTDARWVRVTDDERNLRWVGINQPITRGEVVKMQAMEAQQPLPPGLLESPEMQEVVGVRNKLTELDVDIILEDGPDTVTVQAEQFKALVDLKRADPSAIPTEAIIKASDLRNKDEIMKLLEQQVPPQVQAQMQAMQQALQQMQGQLQEAEQKAADKRFENMIDAMKLQLDREKLREKTADDLADNEREDYRAETDRMQAVNSMQPEQPPQGGFLMPEENQGGQVQ